MSFPNIPNITPSIDLTREEVINLLLASIAFEELGLAHIINAEAEKIQAVVGTLPNTDLAATTISELTDTNESVNRILKTVLKTQMLLQFKLEDVIGITTETTTSTTTTTTTTTTTETTTTETTTTETTTTETTTTETTTTETTTTETTTTETTTTETTTTETTTTETTTTETTTTETTTTTTTSTTSTTTTTTEPQPVIFQNIASATGEFNNETYSENDNAFYNSTEIPVISGYNFNDSPLAPGTEDILVGGINLGELPNYLFFFGDGRDDANWQGATKGFVGDVAVDGIQADERTSGGVPYAGTIYTNDITLGAWQDIVDQNDPPEVSPAQAFGSTGNVSLISNLETDLVSAFQQINALPASPGFASVSAGSLDGLNTQNNIDEVFVINVTSGFTVSSEINITGDPGDVYILRWDTDANPINGYQGQVKFQSGGAIVPLGGLEPTNFIHVAGDINSSGGGTTPLPPYPQGPRFDDGQGALIDGGSDFSGGGFFTGYWLTTGDPTIAGPGGLLIGSTQSLSNGIFVGGWYTLTTQFSMTSGTSGVYVSPNPNALGTPSINIVKEVSVDQGVTWDDANSPNGPFLNPGDKPWFRYTVTNTGDVPLTDIEVIDNIIGTIGTLPILNPGGVHQFVAEGF
ncbi:hypothetical protein [Rossellomorea aquimaris]|uniref:hypothetical protein n=1 Tax=Rossellomorea aquimaris TaxID=189382 RepID=UPI0007D09B7A|nr:hypothetical protein [Rossellomorea aquimaris]